MPLYSIYTNISHVSQLILLRPELVKSIREELYNIAERFGGRQLDTDFYFFPISGCDAVRKAAEAAKTMQSSLRKNKKELFGTTVLVLPAEVEGLSGRQYAESLILRVPDDNDLWMAKELEDDFKDFFELEPIDGLLKVSALKDVGLRLEERLPRLLVRKDQLHQVRQALNALELNAQDQTILLMRGCWGAGKRATLKKALQMQYPDDNGEPLILPISIKSDAPMEPFFRALRSAPGSLLDFLNSEDNQLWKNDGENLMQAVHEGRIGETVRDQFAVDLIQLFSRFLKAYIYKRNQSGRPAYLVLDGLTSESEFMAWFRPLLAEFKGFDSFRLIVIHDTEDFTTKPSLLGKVHDVVFKAPEKVHWESFIREASPDAIYGKRDIARLAKSCGANLYKLFYAILGHEAGWNPEIDPEQSLVASLSCDLRCTLFLVHLAGGMLDKSIFVQRFTSIEEQSREGVRYDELIAYGLIREDADGRISEYPGSLLSGYGDDLDAKNEARKFGEFLYRYHTEKKPLDLFLLYHYLKRWGPMDGAIVVLGSLLSSLLTQRRFGEAGALLNTPPMSHVDLESPDIESLQNIMGATWLRYVLLTGSIEDARNLIRKGIVPPISERGAFAEWFQLANALFSYAAGRLEDALALSKDALFTFQKTGDHNGETHSHIELALALLALGKVRDAREHFEIAQRIGRQVGVPWGVLRASTLEVVSLFLLGNLPQSARECHKNRTIAHREGRRDLWLLLTLLSLRIAWELGRYGDVVRFADEGYRVSQFYNLPDEQRVMNVWKGRGQAALGYPEGIALLKKIARSVGSNREAFAFLAEHAWFSGDIVMARKYIRSAASIPRRSIRLQGEADDWSDGFFPVEGRLMANGVPLDVLGEWIRGFDAYLAAQDGDKTARMTLDGLLEQDGRRISRPFSYVYALWAALVVPDEQKAVQNRYMSRAFNDLQSRAGRFDDNQAKHAWLSANQWNIQLLEEAQRRKFL